VPLKADEDLCGFLQRKERVSRPDVYAQRVVEEEAEDNETGQRALQEDERLAC